MPLHAQTNVSFQYFYDDLGQLTKAVDSTGNVVEYVYDPVGNILQIKRSAVAPDALAIFSFTPQRGGLGQSVAIQGQGFDQRPTNNAVQFNGTTAPVLSASTTTLTVTVPATATTGPISVTVSGQTATSTNNFTVLPSPVITAIGCKSAFFNKVIPNLQVSGFNLSGSTFGFAPAFSTPPINVTAASVDASGNSAVLSLQVGTQPGTFVLVATNPAGSSSALPSPTNRFTVVDPRSTADSSGNGFPDVIKETISPCSDLLDPNNIPLILPAPEAESLTVSVLNGAAPPHVSPAPMEADSLTVSLLNGVAPPQGSPPMQEANSLTVSLLNGMAPANSVTMSNEVDSLTVSLVNGTAPPAQPTFFEAGSLTVSLSNSAPQATASKVVLDKKAATPDKKDEKHSTEKPKSKEEPPIATDSGQLRR